MSGVGLYFSYSNDKRLKNFFKKRALRIFPAAFIVLILKTAITGGVTLKEYLQKIFLLQFFITGNKEVCFFSLLMFLYITYPILHKIIDKYRLKGTIGLVLLIICFNFMLMNFVPIIYKKLEIALTRIPVFICGIFMGQKIKDNTNISKKWMFLFLLILIFITFLIGGNSFSLHGCIVRYMYGPLAISIVILVAYFCSVIKFEIIESFLEWIGSYSMEIYLLYEYLGLSLKKVFVFNDSSFVSYYIAIFILTLVFAIILKNICNIIKRELF